MRCGRSGLVRLAAVGRAPRLCRAGGGGVTAGRVRFPGRVCFPVHRRAALVGGGIAAAPKFVVDMCVLEPMPAARAVCARAVHPRAGRVVYLCSVRPHRATSARQRRRHRGGAPGRALCWRCACLRCRACVPHARVACTCCACPCCACLCCALSCGVWCACAALIYIVWSSPTLHPRRPWRLAMTFTLSPFSVTYACSCHALFLPLCPISCLCCSFFLFHILLYTLSCSCLRLCLRKVAQVSLSAVELPGHLFVPALPSGCLVFFFATKKKTRGRVTVPPIALNRIALVCPHTCACNAVLRAPPFKAPSKAHFLKD